jgi:hypothetical protein
MATITLTYPDDQQQRIVNALCEEGGWTPESGVTRGAFAKRMVVDYVKRVVVAQDRAAARAAALAAVPLPADPDVT